MQTLRPLAAALFCVCLLAASAAAQTQTASTQSGRAPVTASATSDRVRFAAPNSVARLRLEVLSQSGEVLAELGTRGSVLDWTLTDSQGNRLADGQYLCVLTIKDVAGRLSQRLTLVELAGGVAAARAATQADLTPRQSEAVGPVEAAEVLAEAGETAATLLAHDGTDGQLVTTSGDLSFRGGDFFTGRDKELMRLSADGSLEVSGTLLARGGIRFADGTVLESAQVFGRAAAGGKGAKPGTPSAGGGVTPSATLDRLAKFDAGGQLVDSAVAETGGNVGVGRTTGLSYKLEVQSATTASGIRSVGTAALGAGSGGGMALEANAIPTAANQRLGAFFWGASNGTTTYNPAIVAGYSAEAWTSTNRGAYFEFEATAEGASTRSKVLRIAATGQAGLFTAPSPSVRGLVVRGATSQTANLQEWQNQAGTALAVIGSAGNVNFTGLRTVAQGNSPNVIGGHSSNAVTTGVWAATIGGGGLGSTNNNNRVTDHYSTVGGGAANQAGNATGDFLDADYATVGGGGANKATGASSTIAGGFANMASSLEATVGGGGGNTASGNSSTIPGGSQNTAAGNFGFAAGRRAHADHEGTFVWGDATPNEFFSSAPNQFLIDAAGGVGINTNSTSAATLNVAGSGLFTGNLTVGGTLNASAISPSSIPAGSGHYIQSNPASQQTGASFNISGGGTMAGALVSGGLTADVNTLHVDAANHRVGVGTTAPQARLHVVGPVLASTNAGAATAITVGERYRDNALIGWGKIFANGVVNPNESFGITVARDAVGVYTVTLLSSPTHQSVPVAVAEVDAAPASAADARLVTVDQINLTSFKVYITNGSFSAVDNDFLFMVTGR